MNSTAEKRALALAERARLRATLARLTPEQWATPSLCGGWTVREVAGHVADSARVSMARFLVGVAGTRFDHDEYNRRSAAAWAKRPTAEIVGALDTKRMMSVFWLLPGMLLVDTVVHHQDIRRPLGLAAVFPAELLDAALTSIMTESAFASAARRVAGRRLVATDIDWSHGEGPDLSGPAESLIMHVMGRPVRAAELSPAATTDRISRRDR